MSLSKVMELKSNKLKIKKFLFGLFRVDFWYQQHPYSSVADFSIEYILEQKLQPTAESFATISFGSVTLWTGNYPFSYGYEYNFSKMEDNKPRPSRYNIYRLKKYLDSREITSMTNKDYATMHLSSEMGFVVTYEETRQALLEMFPEKFI